MNNTPSSPSSLSSHYRILRWIVTLAWAGLIFDLSTETFGASFTAVVLRRLLAVLRIQLSPSHFEALHFVVRKSAHFTEYGIFSLLLYVSISRVRKFDWQPHIAFWSVVIAGLYSLTDEFHQMFVPNRGPSLKDCALDTTGAVVAMLLVRLFTRGRREAKRAGPQKA